VGWRIDTERGGGDVPRQSTHEIANEAANRDRMANPDSASPETALPALPVFPVFPVFPAYLACPGSEFPARPGVFPACLACPGVFLACRGLEFPAFPECSAYRGCWERPECRVCPARCLPGSFAPTHSWLQ
jgi:hypothetical protein